MGAGTVRKVPLLAPVVDVVARRRAALRAERESIERRQYADMLRLGEIRVELLRLADEPTDG